MMYITTQRSEELWEGEGSRYRSSFSSGRRSRLFHLGFLVQVGNGIMDPLQLQVSTELSDQVGLEAVKKGNS